MPPRGSLAPSPVRILDETRARFMDAGVSGDQDVVGHRVDVTRAHGCGVGVGNEQSLN